MSNAKCVMVLGTASNVGKSSVALALSRWLHLQGVRVTPFKAMSMGPCSYRTASGERIHAHQAQQAIAAGLEPRIEMNPVMLESAANGNPSVLLRGQPLPEDGSARAEERTQRIRSVISDVYTDLAKHHDYIVVEGCGSPVELNIKERDLANLWVAQTFDMPCVLVANVEDAGVFGALVGTLDLMTAAERARIIGFVINKFHGDPTEFSDGARILEDRTGLPCLGVIPFMQGLERISADWGYDEDTTAPDVLEEEIGRWTAHVVQHLDTQRLAALAFGAGQGFSAVPGAGKLPQQAPDAGYAHFELIWQSRVQLGDEPGVFGDAHFAGLCVELPFNLQVTDMLGSSEILISIEAENVHTFGPYPGHRATIIQYHPLDPANLNGPWAERVLGAGRLLNDTLEIPIDLAGIAEELVYLSLRLEIDTTVRAGLYNDFVLKRLGKRSADFRYTASFGFVPPL